MVEIKQFELKYLDDARQVCLNTGPKAARENADERDKLLAVYCDYYCEKEPQNAFVLVDENDVAQGYILCAENAKNFRKEFSPYMDKLRKHGVRCRIEPWGEQLVYSFFGKKYPAHLHIDINKDFRRNGNGTRMIQTLLDHLKNNGIRGVMLIVGSGNDEAIRFYKRNGFKILCSLCGGTVMAKEL